MELKDCIQFANQNPVCHLATTEGDQPRVRVLRIWRASEEGFFFCGLAPKNLWNQLRANPKVEICFFNNAATPADAKSLRVTGKVEFLEDFELKAKILEERPFYKNFGTGQPDDPTYPLVRVAHGEAWFWTMRYARREAEAERIRF